MSPYASLAYVKLERVTRVAALGVRFYDPARQRFVSDLQVVAQLQDAGGRPTRRSISMFPGPSGIFALHGGVDGWADLETLAGAQPQDNSFWSNLPPGREVLVSVTDPLGRYLPFTFSAAAPHKGLFGYADAGGCLLFSPDEAPWPPDAMPLFPAPGGPKPEGMAAVRAEIWRLDQPGAPTQPVGGAVLEVMYDGRVVSRGIADSRGIALALMPFPPPVDFTPDSPGTGEASWLQNWNVQIGVAASAGAQPWSTLPGALPQSEPYLDLCTALSQQGLPRATVWASRSPDQPLANALLRARADLILASVVGGVQTSRLLITPVA